MHLKTPGTPMRWDVPGPSAAGDHLVAKGLTVLGWVGDKV